MIHYGKCCQNTGLHELLCMSRKWWRESERLHRGSDIWAKSKRWDWVAKWQRVFQTEQAVYSKDKCLESAEQGTKSNVSENMAKNDWSLVVRGLLLYFRAWILWVFSEYLYFKNSYFWNITYRRIQKSCMYSSKFFHMNVTNTQNKL